MPATLARLICEEPTARRLAALIERDLDDVAVSAFESGGGWTVEMFFAAPPDADALRRLIAAETGGTPDLQFDTVAERDWVAASLAGLKPVRAGRFLVHGAHDRATVSANAIGLEIEAALAFGTGHHGTTRGCLLALDALAKRRPRRRVLDVGTGTGVLGIAAHRIFHGGVYATDIDRAAVAVARGNARLNGASVEFYCADARRALPWRGRFDLIFANILLEPLTRMAQKLAPRLAPGGVIVLSGLLPAQANAARAIYAAHGLTLERRLLVDGWATLVMRRG